MLKIDSFTAANEAAIEQFTQFAQLSLANAQRTRHDLFPSDTARTNPASGTSGTARRDSTGGDATADTSGGAAKPRPRRP